MRKASRDGRQRVLQALRRAAGPIGVHEVADLVDLHENSVRFHLDRLVADGAATRHAEPRTGPRTGPGRPRLTYAIAAESGTHGDRRDFRLLAEILAGALSTHADARDTAVEAGRRWGRYLARPPRPFQRTGEREALDELLRVLDEVGFAPDAGDPEPSGHELTLRHCPFLEVATEHQEVVCAVHLGLMQGTLAELDAPLVARSLTPWATPSSCVANLGPPDPGD